MASAADPSLVERFEQFYRDYCREEIGDLARKYPADRRSLYLDWEDLYRFDPELAEDFVTRPEETRDHAEEALRVFDLPVDVKLGGAHVRLRGLPPDRRTDIGELRARHVNTMVSVTGIVRKATDVQPKVREAAFECRRCGTLTRVPQSGGQFRDPEECGGCERQGPFELSADQSEFVDSQQLRVQESPEGMRGGETPSHIDVSVADDITGQVSPGDRVVVTGILRLDTDDTESTRFDTYVEGVSVEIEDEEFEDMSITESEKREIVRLSESEDVYGRIVDSIAPSIWGYDQQKLALALQLFSGVTKELRDGTRIRGDLHMLLIGDPGTGKCQKYDTKVALGDGRTAEIGALVEAHLDDPTPVDDGVRDAADFEVPSLTADGRIENRRARRVWKREAPDRMYRIRTAGGRELEVTPSHPLFVVEDGGADTDGAPAPRYRPVEAEDLQVGTTVAVAPPVAADGGVAEIGGVGPTGARQVSRDRIASIETVDPEYDWVYDLEVEGTHNYISEGVVSHNSQLLQYVSDISPRSVYTSGKGSSAAGLCVTGDTRVHTADGFRPIGEVAREDHPDPVDAETAAPRALELYTYDPEDGAVVRRDSSHVWRMPARPCRRIETTTGRELEASLNTPVLTCGADGIEWTPIREVEAGDYVATPSYDSGDIERSAPPVREFFEFDEEKLLLDDASIDRLRAALREAYGDLRTAAAELDLSEDFVYDTLPNRHVPVGKLDRVLDAVGLDRSAVGVRRAMVRHGEGVRIPESFDADLMYLVGLVFGDGDIRLDRRDGNRGMVRIANGDEELLERAVDIVAETFDKDLEIERQDDRVPYVRLHSTTVARFFRNLGMATPKTDLRLTPRLTTAEHADAFLRGLMDADGSVSVRPEGGSSVQFSTVSAALAEQVTLMLDTYGVHARRRERDRRGTHELADGRTIESRNVQHHVEIYGRDVDAYADAIGFGAGEKRAALDRIAGETDRRDERVPVGGALAAAGASSGRYGSYLSRGSHPGRDRARAILDDATVDLGPVESTVAEAVDADLRWDEVAAAVDTGPKEVYDLTVPGTQNFFADGVVTHNTAAAVRDDFGEGQQWSLEAGALVLADQGVAAVDELDKMRCVTGDTLVRVRPHAEDSEGKAEAEVEAEPDPETEAEASRRIDELAAEAAASGSVESLSNGRTVRDVGLEALTMTDDRRLEYRPVTAVHEYEAPERLRQVRLETGQTVTTTADHPFFVDEDGDRTERAAEDLAPGDMVYVPRSRSGLPAVGDGGTVTDPAPDGEPADRTVPASEDGTDVALRTVASVETVAATDEAVDADGRGPRVYDLTVEGTHNFIADGFVIHNSEDRSAMHEALEQQSVSISKAGINATLKSRCSLLGAANPKYGRFDQYEPVAEQIELEPALVSRFDLIFTVTDEPDEQQDRELAEHILETNYAGEVNVQRAEMTSPDVDAETAAEAAEAADPEIDPELLRKYVAYARQECHPRMTEAARTAIREFYTDLRAEGADEDAPVPVTARKLEALVRLAEASARIRLSDTVDREDADRVIDIVQASLEDVGMDPESGELDADIVEAGTSKSQRDRIKSLTTLIEDVEAEYDEGAPVDVVLDRAEEVGMDPSRAEDEIEKLKRKGEVYEPSTEHLRTT